MSDRLDLAATGNAGLNGSATQAANPANPLKLARPSVLDDWLNIDAYVQRIRPPRGASNVDPARVARGLDLFTNGAVCQGCHGGAKWTISTRFYLPSNDTMSDMANGIWVAPFGMPDKILPAASSL